MDDLLNHIQKEGYKPCGFDVEEFQLEPESKEYHACRFKLNGRNIRCRNAKITPKKTGQFVTFWKRADSGQIEPFDASDPIDYYVVNVCTKTQFGQFVFPKSILLIKGIITTENREGKRAFRVYPNWDETNSKQGKGTQVRQLDYFYQINSKLDFKEVSRLYI